MICQKGCCKASKRTIASSTTNGYDVYMPKKAVASIHIRIPATLKKEAEKVIEALGLDASSAIRLFYTQITLQQTIPFPLPKVRTASPEAWKIIREALEDARVGPFTTAEETLKALYAKR